MDLHGTGLRKERGTRIRGSQGGWLQEFLQGGHDSQKEKKSYEDLNVRKRGGRDLTERKMARATQGLYCI